MSNLVIVGAQWGDEGKGKFVDIFTEHYDVVVRYQGGHNAGHTVIIGDAKYVLHLLPSGILHPQKLCAIGNGLVVDPSALMHEVDFLASLGIDVTGRLFISDRAQLILPWHRAVERADEAHRGHAAIGTTLRGIGPAYGDKYFRNGIRAGLARNDEMLRRQCARFLEFKRDLSPGVDPPPESEWEEFYRSCGRMREYVADTSLLLHRWLNEDQRIIMEGAQGTMLDVEFGTYPFVTSSHSTAGGAAVGTGVPPHRLGLVVGIMKAYTTRVGAGPFPTELHDDAGQRLRQRGGEFGASTGRPRRCGWLDLFQMRYSCRINGFHSLLMTKLDVLDPFAEIPVCTGYRHRGEPLETMPDDVEVLQDVEPIYQILPGWNATTAGMQRMDDLPAAARRYIAFIEEFLGVELGMISTGPERRQTVLNPQAVHIHQALQPAGA
jgi:adenylosuccinate synthase